MTHWPPSLGPRPARLSPAAAAAAGFAAACALGSIGATAPGLAWAARTAGVPDLAGLALVVGLGLLAWHIARLTVSPTADAREAALLAALIAVVSLPGLAIGAVTVPLLLSIFGGWGRKDQRVVAVLVQCGATLAALAGPNEPLLYCFAGAMMLAATGFALRRPASGAANDNPQMERAGPDSGVPISMCYVIGDSQSGSGEYGSV